MNMATRPEPAVSLVKNFILESEVELASKVSSLVPDPSDQYINASDCEEFDTFVR